MDETVTRKHGLFTSLSGEETVVNETSSLCMACGDQGVTRFLLCRIPHFQEVIIMAFECPKCGFRNNSVQSAAEIKVQGVRILLDLKKAKDLDRQVVRTEKCTYDALLAYLILSLFLPFLPALVLLAFRLSLSGVVCFPELELSVSPSQGTLTTVQGVIQKAMEDLAAGQAIRAQKEPEAFTKIQAIVTRLSEYLMMFEDVANEENQGKAPVQILFDDPSGNSYVENPNAPGVDPSCAITWYDRTVEQDEALGISAENPNAGSEAKAEPEENPETELQNEVQTFQAICSQCGTDCETRMHMLDIPHFKEVIVMSTVCSECGFKSNEVKAGGAISKRGRRISLKLTTSLDLSRDILKSETCGLQIPEISLELEAGTLGGRFTTIEGLLRQVYQDLDERSPFRSGDGVSDERKKKFEVFLARLDEVIRGKWKGDGVTLILDDAMANSYVQNLYAPDPDPEMKVEDYDRTWEQNEVWGLNDIKTEGYEQQ
ncbi:MAG: hypothetical protein SGCHY_003305 [Lobulomycetales sp.]